MQDQSSAPDIRVSSGSAGNRDREDRNTWLSPTHSVKMASASDRPEAIPQRYSKMSWLDESSSNTSSSVVQGGLVSSPTHHKPLSYAGSVAPSESGGTMDHIVPPPENMDLLDWYHFSISRHVAESVLISTGEDGSYLLRDSSSSPGEFTLSVRAKKSVKHFPVRWDGKEFTFGFGKFANVDELQAHFSSKPVIGGESGVLTLLKFPYPRCVEEPETYDQIRVHAEWGAPERKPQGDTAAPTFAIASKEGYLTKLGYHRKNWLTRWFVLYKNELSYYKSREEKTPIKTVNLKDVHDVIADDSQGKQNCFRIITAYRTFFLYAGSAQEAEDWIKILRWKLDHPSGTETAKKK